MKTKLILFVFFVSTLSCSISAQEPHFDIVQDLLVAQFDCKTDVDDLHTVAAFATLMAHKDYKNLEYHAVAGTYGIQEGLYVPAEDLFELAFEDEQWSDAHNATAKALNEVLKKVNITLLRGGDVWIADAGQSDFSAKWIKALIAIKPQLDVKKRIHIVQHSDWNEEVTSPDLLKYVKATIDYHKIPDGNAVGNGTPGFRSDENIKWKNYLKNADKLKAIWELAVSIGNDHNGKEGRYLNTSIAAGGLDFSDLSEVCYILGIEKLEDANEFFEMISKK
jgi:hypothetical protein